MTRLDSLPKAAAAVFSLGWGGGREKAAGKQATGCALEN